MASTLRNIKPQISTGPIIGKIVKPPRPAFSAKPPVPAQPVSPPMPTESLTTSLLEDKPLVVPDAIGEETQEKFEEAKVQAFEDLKENVLTEGELKIESIEEAFREEDPSTVEITVKDVEEKIEDDIKKVVTSKAKKRPVKKNGRR